MTLFIHIGTHKTGTTSIQNFADVNRERLRRLGLWYPPVTEASGGTLTRHHDVSHALSNRGSARLTEAQALQFFARIRRSASNDEHILVSCEAFYRHARTSSPGQGYWDAKRAYIECVKRAALDATIIVYLRRQDRFAESVYKEMILGSGYSEAFPEFLRAQGRLFEYRRHLDLWRDVFGADKVKVVAYEERAAPKQFLISFFANLGVAIDETFDLGHPQRVSPPSSIVEFKRLLNLHGFGKRQHRTMRRILEQIAASATTDAYPDPPYFSADERARFTDRYEAQNRQVARSYCGREDLFFEPDPPSQAATVEQRKDTTESALAAAVLHALLDDDAGVEQRRR